jgi:hypothetical protein
VTLYGLAQAPALIELSQPALPEWSLQPAEQWSYPVTLTVTNVGDVPSGPITPRFLDDVSGFAIVVPIETTVSVFPCSAPLNGGASCKFDVKFFPETAYPNKQDQRLQLSATPGGATTTNLEGTGLWQLTVSTDCGGTGTVTVTSDTDVGLSCPSTSAPCTVGFTDSATVNLTATPTGVAYFGGWSPNCPLPPPPPVSTGPPPPPPCGPIIMTTNVTVNASFCVLM